jgi:5'-phosphate synthase pdxT subunit
LNTGILALQGSFHEHSETLKLLNRDFVFIKSINDLENINSLIFPGGESTAMLKIQENSALFNKLGSLIKSGIPTLGTCAGLILLSGQSILGKDTINAIDCIVQRNGYGRQNQSFEAKVQFEDFTANYCFIRAPKIISYGDDVDPIAYLEKDVVGLKRENVVGLSFHPELTNDHNYLSWLDSFLKKGSNVGSF